MTTKTAKRELAGTGLTASEMQRFQHCVWLLLQASGNTAVLDQYQLHDMKRLIKISMHSQGVWGDYELSLLP